MSVMQVEQSVAATTSVVNLIAGSAFEFARTRQIVSIGVTASATGSFITITSGADVVLEESPPMVLTTMPIVPDHMYYNDVMEIGDRLRIGCRNPTGGAITIRVIVQVNPIA